MCACHIIIRKNFTVGCFTSFKFFCVVRCTSHKNIFWFLCPGEKGNEKEEYEKICGNFHLLKIGKEMQAAEFKGGNTSAILIN